MFTITHHHEGEYHWTVTHTDQGRTYLRSTYAMGWDEPNYPMPAIPLEVKYDYLGCVNIDDVSDEDDPIIVYMFDSWTGQNV